MSGNEKGKYDAYGHLRKKIEEKQLQKGVNSSGDSKIVQIFFINVIIIHFTIFWYVYF